MKPCSRCSRGFFATHGNQNLCGTCKTARKSPQWWQATYRTRECARCRREFEALSANQKFCSRRCKELARPRHEIAKYARPEHRGTRKRLAPLAGVGLFRCARGPACKHAEFVDGELVGGLIRPGQLWDLGHADGESVGGVEHRECNRAAPSRLRAQRNRKWARG
jgi:hypothetical protein